MNEYVNHYEDELHHLLKVVCEHFKQPMDKVLSMNRHKANAYPRHIFHHMAYKYELGSYESIGTITNRDHATVLHSCRMVAGWLTYDKDLARSINALTNKFLNNNEVMAFQEKIKDVPIELMPLFIEYINQFECKQ